MFEKAYAKLYGSYQAINFGNALDAMIDFTGKKRQIAHKGLLVYTDPKLRQL